MNEDGPFPLPVSSSSGLQSRQGHHAAHLACEKRQVRCSSYLSPAVGTGRDQIREQAGRSLANPGVVLHLVQHISPSILFPVSRKWPMRVTTWKRLSQRGPAEASP